ncbi:hypothetical protein Fmac_013316 [Flemingia macrophylla]|uniref:Photosystem II protein I n=1 Tax=Flemingia macrophylla TaxID=520843 RepID=A0ABD1MV23_9FABA
MEISLAVVKYCKCASLLGLFFNIEVKKKNKTELDSSLLLRQYIFIHSFL